MARIQKPIFLSHTSSDKPLVDKLVDLLTNGCAVSPNDILCTTLEGKGIPAGTPSFIEYLREQIQQPKLVIILLSENFFASEFCLCELGAVWGMGLPNFPLVVPPVDKGKLKATLAIAQAGEVNNSAYLDELRDVINEKLDSSVPTATWSAKRDAFLASVEKVIAALPGPRHVPIEKLEEAREQYKAAIVEVQARDEQIDTLKLQISELKKCKDAEEVKKVSRKYQGTEQQFEVLTKGAAAALGKLKKATASALFASQRGEEYYPKGDAEWEDAQEAIEIQEVRQVDSDCCKPNSEHPRVIKAERALGDLKQFLKKSTDYDFLEAFEKEHEFPADLSNKEFWQTFLASI